MKRILINATHNEEIRVALCKDNHLYDFDLENRTREQKKANIYKGHVTRVEPSLEAVFVEYGSARQGFLPLREIAPEYLKGNTRTDNIRELIKEGDELIIQIEKEERGNKGAAVSTFVSLAGRYLVLMPNNQKAGGISRQISGKVRDDMKQILANLSIPKGMSVIVRTAGIGKGFEDLQTDLNHLLDIWASILEQNRTRPSPCLVHQEAGVVTRAVRDYLRDDIGEVWIDSEHAYNEAAHFIASVMPNQMGKLRKYTDYEPLFARFGIERQIETAYQREVRLPSGGSIVIDQTEAMVAIDINSAKSTKGSDVAETAYHTNLEAADEIARQLRLRDMGGLIVIDFIDMNDARHQKEVEKRLIDATRYDRARVQFAEISKFGLMEMSRQRLRPSLEEATGYICPRCHGNGMIRDLRSLALSIMRQIEQIALKERYGEIQAEVPTEIAAFLLNEKRESLVYLEQDSGVRITILPHAHLESPNFSLHYNPDGFAPSSYERIIDVEERESGELGYDTNWHTRTDDIQGDNRWQKTNSDKDKKLKTEKQSSQNIKPAEKAIQPQAVAWLSNLFAPKTQAVLAPSLNSTDAAAAIEALVNAGATSLGAIGRIDLPQEDNKQQKSTTRPKAEKTKTQKDKDTSKDSKPSDKADTPKYAKREAGSRREPRAVIERTEVLSKPVTPEPALSLDKKETKAVSVASKSEKRHDTPEPSKPKKDDKPSKETDITVRIERLDVKDSSKTSSNVIHLSLDNSKPLPQPSEPISEPTDEMVAKSSQPSADASSNDPALPLSNSDDQPVILQETSPDITSTTGDETLATADHLAKDGTAMDDTLVSPAKTETDNLTAAQDSNLTIIHPKTQATPNMAKLTALAQKTGRAINDPRVVTEAYSTVSPLTGTAGELIYARLDDAQNRLAKDGFVVCFLEAINQKDVAFDFANYGYQPLTASDLADFAKQIASKGSFLTPQGKTHAVPKFTGKRAINDPRGDIITEAIPSVVSVAGDTPSAPNDSELSAEVSDDTTQEQQTEPSTLDNVLSTVQEILNHALHKDEPKKAEEKSEGKADGDTKTTPESYKNMIENIAEQLLPPTGILKLASPKKPAKAATKKASKVAIKIPKTDTKPKTEIRKRKPKAEPTVETPQDTSSDTAE